MNTPQQYSNFVIPAKKKPFDHKSFINKSFYHWPLFVIAIIICLPCAYLYLKNAKPVYTIKATLLIKDEKKLPGQQPSKMEELDLVDQSKIVENEVEKLKSRRLIMKVVNDLQLWVTYQTKDKVKNADLYNASPVKILLKPSDKVAKHGINILIKDDRSFFIKQPDGKLKELYFSKPYTSNFGTWILEPTAKIKDYAGQQISIKLSDPETLVFRYQKLIDVSLSNKLASALNISLDDQNAKRGKDILDKLILNYNSAELTDKNTETSSTLGIINNQMDSLKRQLAVEESSIEGFKSGQRLTDVTSEAKINLEDKQVNDRKLNEVNLQLTAIEEIEKYVNSSKNLDAVPSAVGITDINLSNMVKTLSELELQKEKLLATTPETNPDFDPLNRQIDRTRSKIKDNVKTIKSSLQSTKATLMSINSSVIQSIKAIPYQERTLAGKKRSQSSVEDLYTFLLQKSEEISIRQASAINNGRVIDTPYAGPAQMPAPAMVYSFAFFMALILPVGVVYGKTLVNNSVLTQEDIKDVLQLPIVGEVPFERSKDLIVINGRDINPVTEQLRALRARLNHLYKDKNTGRVTMVTSSISAEGKSFTSSNLAMALALAGRKTIILELDIRKPKIATAFGLPQDHAGISDVIEGGATLAQVIQKSSFSNDLDVICGGTPVFYPSELLGKVQLDEMIQQLRSKYDDVIIDSSPVHLVPDALILARFVDLTLYVVRQGFTPKAELEFVKQLSLDGQLPNVNIVFNGINRVRHGYGYNYTSPYYNSPKKSFITSPFTDLGSRF